MKIIKIKNKELTRHNSLTPIIILCLATFPVCANEPVKEDTQPVTDSVEFESDVMRMDSNTKVDLARFSKGSSGTPGIYRVSIIVNNTEVGVDNVELKEGADKSVYPCLTPKILQLINFNQSQLSPEAVEMVSGKVACANLQSVIPDAKVQFDSNEQQLNISIPQIYVNRISSGTVDPALWDSGIPAGLLSYYLNGYDSKFGTNSSRTFYAGLNGGLNIGAWYLRHNGSYNWQQDQGSQYNTINTYLQRDVEALRGRVVLGQSNTSGQLFDSLPFTGARVESDDSMLPDSQRGYAPEIRGIAKTNAKVIVKQMGQIIYETTVTPGAFLINDLYPTGYGGDLDITIQEADGTVQNYSMPYASVAQLLRPGSHHFSLTVGKLRDSNISDKPMLYEATYQRGLTNSVTGYAGVQASENYQAAQIGTALSTLLGAFGVDVTQSFSKIGEYQDQPSSLSGQSYRASYSKLITETDSNITLAAYRFSSSGYMDYMTTMLARENVKSGQSGTNIMRSKNRFALSASQGLAEGWGSFYASASVENYWNNDKYNKQYQFGYSNNFKRVNYSINVSRSQNAYGADQTSFNLNFSFPLWEDRDVRAPTVSLRYNHDNNGGQNEQASIGGALGEDNKYTYNLSGSHDSRSGTSGSVGGTWFGSVAQMSGTYSKGPDYQTTTVGMSGSMVAHSGGVTLSPYTGDTFALVEAKGAEGAKIGTYAGSKVDSFGYAVFPSMRPYQLNDVSIDPEGSSQDVEFENTSQKAVPRSGAVVKVKFNTRTGIPVLITSLFNGNPLPFGAEVFDALNNYVGAVTQGGVIYAKVADMKGTLRVTWGNGAESSCKVNYILAPLSTDKTQKKVPQRFNTPCL